MNHIFENHALHPPTTSATNLLTRMVHYESSVIESQTPFAMSNPFSNPSSLDPEAGFTQTPSIAQAASELRAAAGEKAREFVHLADEKASSLKDRAVESAQHFRETAAERATQFKAAASEKATAFKAAATDKASQLKDTANEQWQDTRVKAKELHVTAEDYIRQNPTKCVLSALGAGFLIGLIVRR